MIYEKFKITTFPFITRLVMRIYGCFVSTSQSKEDSVLIEIIKDPLNCFYLDIGAGHPIWLSNTYALYNWGATGITIDVNSTLMNLHKDLRPKDTQLRAAITSKKMGEVKVYEYLPWVLTTTNKEMVDFYLTSQNLKPIKTYFVPSVDLRSLIDFIPKEKTFLLCIDIEGNDSEILKSLIVGIKGKYLRKPDLIVAELGSHISSNLEVSQLKNEIMVIGYKVSMDVGRNVIFASTDEN